MALAKDLSIYKSAKDLLTLSFRIQPQVPRPLRAPLGARLCDECAAVLVAIARSNVARDTARVTQIEHLLERLEAVVLLFGSAHELKAISHKVWAESIDLTDAVGKQANGWLKSSRNLSAAPAA